MQFGLGIRSIVIASEIGKAVNGFQGANRGVSGLDEAQFREQVQGSVKFLDD